MRKHVRRAHQAACFELTVDCGVVVFVLGYCKDLEMPRPRLQWSIPALWSGTFAVDLWAHIWDGGRWSSPRT